MKRSFKGCLDLDVAGGSSEDEEEEDNGNEDSDDELMATATRLSLRCPLGLVSGGFTSSDCEFLVYAAPIKRGPLSSGPKPGSTTEVLRPRFY